LNESLSTTTDPCAAADLSVEDAVQAVLAEARTVSGVEVVPFAEAVGRVLAEDIVVPHPVPGHTNAAVDGFAFRACDLDRGPEPTRFRVIGESLAGSPFAGVVGIGETVRIMTGAVLPDGADTVVMQEEVRLTADAALIGPRCARGANIRLAGEDWREGEIALTAGRWLTPADIGAAASLGLESLRVVRRVEVAVLSTGSEVRAAGQALEAGSVYDSNRQMLLAALRRLGVIVHDLGIVPDDEAEIARRLLDASARCDAILTSGGVSAGKADLVRPVVEATGEIRLWRIAMRPGRPFAFGRIGNAALFGLPGNPVSAIVSYYWLVRPALEKAMGITDRPLIPLVRAIAESTFPKRPGRMEFQRAVLQADGQGGYTVRSTGEQGSGMLRSVVRANGLAVLALERGSVSAGEAVPVLPFSAIV
jgi:molybdopterin molybdotransferase